MREEQGCDFEQKTRIEKLFFFYTDAAAASSSALNFTLYIYVFYEVEEKEEGPNFFTGAHVASMNPPRCIRLYAVLIVLRDLI